MPAAPRRKPPARLWLLLRRLHILSLSLTQGWKSTEGGTMAFCDKCGNELKPDAEFCDKCGHPVAAPEAAAPEAAAPEAAPAAPPSEPAAVIPPPPAAAAPTPPPPPDYTAPAPSSPPPPAYAPPTTPVASAPPAPAAAQASGPLAGKNLWMIVGGIIAIAAVVVILFVTGVLGSKDPFVGNWASVDGSAGGLTIAKGDKVTLVDTTGKQFGPFSASKSGDVLTFALSPQDLGDIAGMTSDQIAQLQQSGAVTKLEIKYNKSTGHLTGVMSVTVAGQTQTQDMGGDLKKVDKLPTQ